MSDALVPVGAGDCQCPGSPHPDGDSVYLRPKLGLAAGYAIQWLLVESNRNRSDSAEIYGRLAEAYLLHGVADWNLVDGNGKAIPVTDDNIRIHLLADFTRSARIADAADDLYVEAVIDPLVNRASKSSPTTSTNGSTSASRGGKSKHRKPSKPSSTSTIPMDDTATTSA